jgi:MoaF C-terminal domain
VKEHCCLEELGQFVDLKGKRSKDEVHCQSAVHEFLELFRVKVEPRHSSRLPRDMSQRRYRELTVQPLLRNDFAHMNDAALTNQILGNTFQYDYGDGAYEVHFDSPTTLTWRRVKGQNIGQRATEHCQIQQLSPHTYFIAWIEADGLRVSQVLDLAEKKISVYLFRDQSLTFLNGVVVLKPKELL